jgi:hypothetical protein
VIVSSAWTTVNAARGCREFSARLRLVRAAVEVAAWERADGFEAVPIVGPADAGTRWGGR